MILFEWKALIVSEISSVNRNLFKRRERGRRKHQHSLLSHIVMTTTTTIEHGKRHAALWWSCRLLRRRRLWSNWRECVSNAGKARDQRNSPDHCRNDDFFCEKAIMATKEPHSIHMHGECIHYYYYYWPLKTLRIGVNPVSYLSACLSPCPATTCANYKEMVMYSTCSWRSPSVCFSSPPKPLITEDHTFLGKCINGLAVPVLDWIVACPSVGWDVCSAKWWKKV